MNSSIIGIVQNLKSKTMNNVMSENPYSSKEKDNRTTDAEILDEEIIKNRIEMAKQFYLFLNGKINTLPKYIEVDQIIHEMVYDKSINYNELSIEHCGYRLEIKIKSNNETKKITKSKYLSIEEKDKKYIVKTLSTNNLERIIKLQEYLKGYYIYNQTKYEKKWNLNITDLNLPLSQMKALKKLNINTLKEIFESGIDIFNELNLSKEFLNIDERDIDKIISDNKKKKRLLQDERLQKIKIEDIIQEKELIEKLKENGINDVLSLIGLNLLDLNVTDEEAKIIKYKIYPYRISEIIQYKENNTIGTMIKLDIIKEYIKENGKNDITQNTEYKNHPIGEWLIQIVYRIECKAIGKQHLKEVINEFMEIYNNSNINSEKDNDIKTLVITHINKEKVNDVLKEETTLVKENEYEEKTIVLNNEKNKINKNNNELSNSIEEKKKKIEELKKQRQLLKEIEEAKEKNKALLQENEQLDMELKTLQEEIDKIKTYK